MLHEQLGYIPKHQSRRTFLTSGRPHTTTFDRGPTNFGPNISSRYDWDEGGWRGHQHKRARHSNPHTEETANLASHHFRPPHQPLSRIHPPPTTGTKLPKHFSTPLTCYYWYYGTCNKTDESCIYAHYYDGLVAEPPVKIGSGGVGVAGPDAAKAVGEALELREALREKEQKLKEREKAVKEREKRAKEKAQELSEWERSINRDSDRVRKREDKLLAREDDLFDRERDLRGRQREWDRRMGY